MANDPNGAPAPKRTVAMVVPAPPAPAPVTAPGASPQGHDATTMPVQRPPTEAAPTELDFRRENRPGTHIHGTEHLSEPGGDAQRVRLVPGKVIPDTRYKLLRWLGEGGMGVVYLAEHVDIERKVALKILRFDLSQQADIAQVFRDEARAASRIGSPNIVEIYDFGELSDGRLFFCMELLDGGDLVPDTEETCMEPERLIPIMRQMCKGLYAAHRSGIVHRDIKPENVIVIDKDGRKDVVKLVDFGISTMLAAGREEGQASIAGTPHYMAPEQISGGTFDGRLDQYSLGCMAYELLVGVPPFLADEMDDLLRMQLSELPKPPSQVRPDRTIPADLEAVIMRCIEKEIGGRYADMADLEAALCEAQIAAGISTAWDDLPLPEDIDPARREKLLREMPSPVGEMIGEPKRSFLWPLVAGAFAIVAAFAIWFALSAGQPNDQERDQIEQLTIAARNAAARTYYVYPPISDPDTATAYRKVLELEDLEGGARSHGVKRGTDLRTEFSGILFGLGDKYWENQNTRGFAREYYVQAWMFDETNQKALERAGLTPGMAAQIKEMAASGNWNDAQLATAGWLSALAEEDQAKQQALVDELLADAEDVSPLADAAGRDFLRSKGMKAPAKARKQSEEPASGDADAADSDGPIDAAAGTDGGEAGATDGTGEAGASEGGDEELVLDETPTGTSTKKRTKKKKKDSEIELNRAKKDPERARELAEEGQAALRAGQRSKAEKLFHQAISYDSRNAKALMGLSDVYFDTGKSQKAVLYAEKAVRASPGNAGYRLKLGDAYYKVLAYRDALSAYQKAKDLGSSRADKRIDKANAKVGG